MSSKQTETFAEYKAAPLTETRFPCGQCGAVLTFKIGSGHLECQYCGFLNQIVAPTADIAEHDLNKALAALDNRIPLDKAQQTVQCSSCAASFELGSGVHADQCPFCGTAVVLGTEQLRNILPQALLPFAITANEARISYQRWLKTLWFAPNELKKYAREDSTLNGVYIPYWTYDSQTHSSFRGLRGDVYYEQQYVTTIENGRRVNRTVSVPKIRWTPVSGHSARHFDDVLIGATRTLPRKLTDWLEPWDLHNLIPYVEDYLSGFRSEIYQVNLDEGFTNARAIMDNVIRSDVRMRIGGEHQQIQQLHTRHSHTTFKHVLLPIWTAAFKFRGKTYRFVVNGRNGKTRGERPYSIIKIALAIIGGITLLATAAFMAEQSGMLNQTTIIHYPRY